MIPNKRLQVFVSSTYSDLKDERQAAVHAILSAGHIPAGMELFAAGDLSQLEVIKNWINQSDIFLLILGGCYGSIEPTSGKSYIQLEYEYAVKMNKAVFAVVIEESHVEERVKMYGSSVIEIENTAKYRNFKKIVLSKMVRFWKDPKDIKIAIFETLNDFSKRSDLVGWVPGSFQIDTTQMAEQLAKLGNENYKLKSQVSNGLEIISNLTHQKAELEKKTQTIKYKNLAAKSRGFSQKAKLDDVEVAIQTSEFVDNSLGEISIKAHKVSNTVQSLLEALSSSVSIGLQYGIPLEEFVEKFVTTQFEPNGFVDHPNIKTSSSILDLVFRILAYEYLGRTDLVHYLDKPMISNYDADDWDNFSTEIEYEKEPELNNVKVKGTKNRNKDE